MKIGVLRASGPGLLMSSTQDLTYGHSFIVADVDGDGKDEVITIFPVREDPYAPEPVYVIGLFRVWQDKLVMTWSAEGKFEDWSLRSVDMLFSADIDNDRRDEIILYNNTGYLAVVRFRAVPVGDRLADQLTITGFHAHRVEGMTLPASLDAADIDGDGRQEIIAHNGKGLAVLRKRTEDDQLTITGWHWGKIEDWPLTKDARFLAADIDGDGRDEIIGHNGKGLAVLRKRAEDDQLTITGWHWGKIEDWPLAGDTRFLAADIDADGREEIIGHRGKGLAVLRKRAEDDQLTITDWHWETIEGTGGEGSWPLPSTVPCAADIDGDRRAEVIGVSERGIGVLRQTADGLRLSWRGLAGLPIQSIYIVPADVDGDKKSELFITGLS